MSCLSLALKLTQVDIYTERLRERERRHRILRDYQLIAAFFRQKEKSKKKVFKDERLVEIYTRQDSLLTYSLRTYREYIEKKKKI